MHALWVAPVIALQLSGDGEMGTPQSGIECMAMDSYRRTMMRPTWTTKTTDVCIEIWSEADDEWLGQPTVERGPAWLLTD